MTDTRYVKKEIKDTLNKRKVCFYCNRKVAHKTDKKYYINAIEYDHLRPLSKGGKTDISNMRIACARCNRRKSNKSAFQFEKKVFGSARCQKILG
jgi:5-methylcytosine-specific restriction endonuclease McrA